LLLVSTPSRLVEHVPVLEQVSIRKHCILEASMFRADRGVKISAAQDDAGVRAR
jgi:hypothetical protein